MTIIAPIFFDHPDVLSNAKNICLVHNKFSSYHYISAINSSLGRLPVPAKSINLLRDYLFRDHYFSAYIFKNARILSFQWPSGEKRFFLFDSDGNLLEQAYASAWYDAYPFIQRTGGSLRFTLPDLTPYTIPKLTYHIPTTNYTHFAFDSFAPLAYLLASSPTSTVKLANFPVGIFDRISSWQQDLYNLLPQGTTFTQMPKQTETFRLYHVAELLIPLFSTEIFKNLFLRRYLASVFHLANDDKSHTNLVPSLSDSIILSSRYDDRRNRIRNMDEIEMNVCRLQGKIVDFRQLDAYSKYKLLQKSHSFIGESSGCTNWLLFGKEGSRLIALVDQELLQNPRLIYGGLIYFLPRAMHIYWVKGGQCRSLTGSPIGSAVYPIDDIISLIT